MDTNKKVIFIIVGILFVLTLLMLLLFSGNENNEPSDNNNGNNTNNNNNNDNIEDNNDTILVKEYTSNYSRYFTIQGILYNYHLNLSSKNVNNLINILDDSYIIDNNINSSNIINNVDFYDTYYNNKIEGIKEITLDNGIVIYYVHTLLTEDGMDLNYYNVERISTYEMVIIDDSNNTYSIIPITESIYNKNSVNVDDELSNITNITYNGFNKYSVSNTSDRDIVTMYYYDFQEIMFYNENEKEDILKIYPNSYEMLNETAIDSYELDLENNKITIYDENEYEIVFNINNILDYTVNIYSN